MTVLMLLLGSNTIKILGWKVGAMATPVLMATLAAPFFAYISFGDIQGSRRALMIALTIGEENVKKDAWFSTRSLTGCHVNITP